MFLINHKIGATCMYVYTCDFFHFSYCLLLQLCLVGIFMCMYICTIENDSYQPVHLPNAIASMGTSHCDRKVLHALF